MSRHTKIICTIGPPVDSIEKILELIGAGMDVARLNFSHGTHETHAQTIMRLKKAREMAKKPLAIMLDTKGPEIRVHGLKEKQIHVKPKQKFKLVSKPPENKDEIFIEPFDALAKINKGQKVLFNDGYVITHVVEKHDHHIIVEADNEEVISLGNGVNIPHAEVNLPALTENDISDIVFGCNNDIDIIAASFVRSADHILSIKQLLAKENRSDIPVIAKIESTEGIENFDQILEAADGIMVARGDLGVEVDLSVVPKLQKQMVRMCHERYKPVVIATQMLESMIVSPRPTRAEVSDVANAIYESSTAVMLSGETAKGKFPMQTVKLMDEVIRKTEEDFDYLDFFTKNEMSGIRNISSSVAIAAVKTAYSACAKAIFIYTSSGFTARLIARWRPAKPIVVLTTNEKTYHQLSFLWGVIPVLTPKCKDAEEAFTIMSRFSKEQKIVEFGDLVVMTAGIPFGRKGSTNLMIVDSIGHVLLRGQKGYGNHAEARVAIITKIEKGDIEFTQNKILIIPRCNKEYEEIIQKAKGIILQNNPGDFASQEMAISFAEKYNIPTIVRCSNAMTLLKEGERVVLDAKKGYVYKADEKK